MAPDILLQDRCASHAGLFAGCQVLALPGLLMQFQATDYDPVSEHGKCPELRIPFQGPARQSLDTLE